MKRNLIALWLWDRWAISIRYYGDSWGTFKNPRNWFGYRHLGGRRIALDAWVLSLILEDYGS